MRDFVAFAVKEMRARTGRNPRTEQAVAVEAKRSIHFKPGKGMQARLNREKIEPEVEAERLLRAS